MSEMMWIAVPSGTIRHDDTRDAVLRVLIAPRLDGSSLAMDGMDHWPPLSLVNENAVLKVNFGRLMEGDGKEDGKAHTVGVLHSEEIRPNIRAQPGVWEAFFGPSTIVVPSRRQRDESAPQVEVDSTSSKATTIKSTFEIAAETSLDLDNEETDRHALDEVVHEKLIEHWGGEEPRPFTPPPPSASNDNFQPPDFHRTIAMLREHPAVLRALGLIIELRFPISALQTRFSEGVIQVTWPDAPASIPTIVSPWTKYSSRFLPASTTNISDGMVTLTDDRRGGTVAGDSRWSVVTVDVDDGVRQLRNAARAIATTTADAEKPASSKPFAFPALRTAGLMLVRRDRKDDFAARRRAADFNSRLRSMNEAILTADDLVLGYRIDVQPHTTDLWSSLHEREATYKISRGGTEIIINGETAQEEGHIKAHSAVDYGGDLRKLHADEILARWDGWSLAIPQPNFDANDDNRPIIHPDMPYEFSWKFAVPKGRPLPRLRFGRPYSLRARVADIAGGGLNVSDQACDRCSIDSVMYRRYEPVAPPELVLPKDLDPQSLGPGESVEQMVIRSDFNAGVTEFESNARRLLFAPQSSLKMAEQHKALDNMSPGQIVDMVKRAVAHASQDGPLVAEEVLFPDFAAGGICVFPRRERHSPRIARTQREWSEPWPDLKPKEIVLKERSADDTDILEWEAMAQIEDPGIGDRLIVRLAKAEEITLELSSFLKDSFIDHFAISIDSLPNVSSTTAIVGRHPMVTPARTVTLTHAVRRPLNDPQGRLEVVRKPNETHTFLKPVPDLFGIDPKSTAKLDIAATWREKSDNANLLVKDVPVETFTINRGDKTLDGDGMIHHEFGDTRHRRITYTLTAVSRFQQFFDSAEAQSAFIARTVLPSPVRIPSSARPSPPIVLSTCPAFAWEENREEGQESILRRRRLGGHLRIELKGPWYETGEGEQLAVLVWKDNNPPENIWPFITQAGRNPIYKTIAPDRWPTARDFTLASGASDEVFLKEAGGHVMAVPHEPWFHEGRWFADIAIPRLVNESYWPFVQFAVARYQPDSLEQLELSSVVMTEMVQLPPERTLSVRRDGDKVFVSLKGLGQLGDRDNENKWILTLEQFKSLPGIAADAVDLTALELSTDGIPAWVPVADQSRFGRINQELELQIQPGLGQLRIRIQELEAIIGPEPEGFNIGGDLTGRTVYSDVVVLPGILN